VGKERNSPLEGGGRDRGTKENKTQDLDLLAPGKGSAPCNESIVREKRESKWKRGSRSSEGKQKEKKKKMPKTKGNRGERSGL